MLHTDSCNILVFTPIVANQVNTAMAPHCESMEIILRLQENYPVRSM